MTEDNARFEPIEGEAEFETMAPETVLYWDPVTGHSSAYFRTQKYLKVDGVIRGDVPGIPTGGISLDITNNLHQLYGEGLLDPITGVPVDNVSVGGLMVLIKRAFDRRANEYFAEAADPNETEPEPEEDPSP